MPDWGLGLWLAVGAVIAAGVLAALHAMALALRREQVIHDNKVRAAEIRRQYAAQLNEVIEVDEAVEEVDVEPIPIGPTAPATPASSESATSGPTTAAA